MNLKELELRTKVWFMNTNKPTQAFVSKIENIKRLQFEFTENGGFHKEINEVKVYASTAGSCPHNYELKEGKFATSKEELLKLI